MLRLNLAMVPALALPVRVWSGVPGSGFVVDLNGLQGKGPNRRRVAFVDRGSRRLFFLMGFSWADADRHGQKR